MTKHSTEKVINTLAATLDEKNKKFIGNEPGRLAVCTVVAVDIDNKDFGWKIHRTVQCSTGTGNVRKPYLKTALKKGKEN